MKKKRDGYPLILVKWTDHTASAEWETPEQAAASQLGIFWTVGYLVHENKQKIDVCQCVEEGGTRLVGNRSTIAKQNILSRHELELT